MAKVYDFKIDGIEGTYTVAADGSEAIVEIDGARWVLKRTGEVQPEINDPAIDALMGKLHQQIWPEGSLYAIDGARYEVVERLVTGDGGPPLYEVRDANPPHSLVGEIHHDGHGWVPAGCADDAGKAVVQKVIATKFRT
jgi:hypothetical protein